MIFRGKNTQIQFDNYTIAPHDMLPYNDEFEIIVSENGKTYEDRYLAIVITTGTDEELKESILSFIEDRANNLKKIHGCNEENCHVSAFLNSKTSNPYLPKYRKIFTDARVYNEPGHEGYCIRRDKKGE